VCLSWDARRGLTVRSLTANSRTANSLLPAPRAAQDDAADLCRAHVAERGADAAVEDEGDGELRVGVGPGAGAAEAVVAEGARRRAGGGRGAVIAEPPVHRERHDEIDAARLHGGGARYRALGEQARAVECAAGGECRVELGERAGGEQAVGG